VSKIICITGSSGGIAKEIQTKLLQNDNIKIYGCSRKKFSFKNKNYFHKTLDASNQKSVKKWFKEIFTKEKKIDILICLAGSTKGGNLVFNLKNDEDFKSNLNDALKSTIVCNREVIKYFIKNQSGSIINFSSIASKKNLIGSSIYSSAKSAVTTFTKILAKENIKFKMNANIIIPMLIENADTKKRSKKWKSSILSLQDTVDDKNIDTIVDLILFLNKKNNYLITGQEISIGTVV
jgi:NADP-dependent 3-hydroxy acid dehydrogenase YdfG